ncbi:MAG: CPBP family intramembrane metalloprotease [Methanoregulaceae archaeon]|nr:CPBP family intramembrane metalloprotease [Methanoregulaceae archaeon]
MDPESVTRRKAIGLAMLIWILVLVFSAVAGVVQAAFNLTVIQQIAVFDTALSIAGFLLLSYFGWWRSAGYLSTGRIRQYAMFIPPAAIAFVSFSESPAIPDLSAICGFALLALLIGFAEETTFRGLIQNALLPLGAKTAVLFSAFLFGVPHLLNALGGIWDPVFAVADTVAAFGIGVSFAALRFRTGTIWPLIGIHALIDLSAFIALGGLEVPSQSAVTLLVNVLVGAGLGAYGLYLIRRCDGNPEAGCRISSAE